MQNVGEKLGARIKGARKALGISQNELSQRLGVSQSLVTAWERADRAITVGRLYDIAGALDVVVGDLLPPTSLTYGDLSDPAGNEVLYCSCCDSAFSANAGDYWSMPDDRAIVCGECGDPMVLAVPLTGYQVLTG